MTMRTKLCLLLCVVVFTSSCAAAGAVALLAVLLDDAAPTRVVSGEVTYLSAGPHPDALVQMKAGIAGDDDTIVESDQIGPDGGAYSIKFKWNNEVSYTFRIVTEGGVELYSEELGKIEKVDFQKDVTLP